MSGAFCQLNNKDINTLLIFIARELEKAESMNLYLDSDIIIKKENKKYVAYFRVSS